MPPSTQSACINVISTRKFAVDCADTELTHGTRLQWHRLSDTVNNSPKDLTYVSNHPLIIEAPPMAVPRFEDSLHRVVDAAVTSGQQVVVFCVRSVRRVSQRAEWAHHWNRKYRDTFAFEQRCMCSYEPTVTEHRSVIVAPLFLRNQNAVLR